MAGIIETRDDANLAAVAKREPTTEGDDPLAWLGDKEEILKKVNMGYHFFQAEISLPNGKKSKIAFCGEAEHGDEATNHTIYVEWPEILNNFKGLRYDENKKAWLIENETKPISLEGHDGVYFLKENGANARSDVTEMTLRAIIELQKENGSEVAWLSPEVDSKKGLYKVIDFLAEYEKAVK